MVRSKQVPQKTKEVAAAKMYLHLQDKMVRSKQVPQKAHEVAAGKRMHNKKKQAKSVSRALQEIRKYQRTTTALIPRAAFCRVVREILVKMRGREDLRIQLKALLALQEAAEAYLTCLFEDMQFVALHAKRVTVMPRDLECVMRLRKPQFQ
uniref:Histone domain-containing protein n=1 Tax=Steinernema glaseri TaxID=37863 RepID=A0A1I7ZXE7_9BILA